MRIKKALSLFLSLVVALSLFAGAIPANAEAAGLTVKDGWYLISTADELVKLSRSMAYYNGGTVPIDAKIRLMADIDMAGNDGYRPIGDNSGENGYFIGEFDGSGHIISNLKLTYSDEWNANLVDSSASLYVGFFGYIAGGHVYDLGLVNVDFASPGSNVGGMVGMMVGGTIERCFVTGKVTGGGSYVGGFDGRQRIGAQIIDCYAFVDVVGKDAVGGIVGTQLSNTPASVRVENCLFSGTVEAFSGGAGGIVGTIAPVEGNSFAACKSVASSVVAAGTAGAFSSSNPGDVTVSQCAVSADMQVGGATVTEIPTGVSKIGLEQLSTQAGYASWNFNDVWMMKTTAKGSWPVLRTFGMDAQPAPPWLLGSTAENDATGYTQPSGGGSSPRSVTYLWDSFNQPAGQFSARFNWVTFTALKDTVLLYATAKEFASTGKYSHRVVGTSSTVDVSANAIYTGTDNISLEPVQSHKAETGTLLPGTEYVWCVGNGGRNVYTGSFTTPVEKTDNFDFIWISDPQTNGSSYKSSLEWYQSRAKKAIDMAVADYPDAAFILDTGDNVNFTFDTWEWDAFFAANQKTFDAYPFYTAAGNHEYDGYVSYTGTEESIDPAMTTIKGRFNAPKNGAAYYGGGTKGTQPLVNGLDKVRLDGDNYYFVYGDTLFMVLENVNKEEAVAEQIEWMKSVVKNNPTKWRVAAMHVSLFPGYRDQPGNYLEWTKGFDEAGVDVVLMGHEHLYLRTKLFADGRILDDKTAYGDGTTYITGNPGTQAMGYFYSARPYTEVFSEEFGMSYAALSITPKEIRISPKGYKNNETLTVVEKNALVTNKPRTPKLDSYAYPAAAAAAAAKLDTVMIGGVAKEDQTLLALTNPRGATSDYQWQYSANGKDGWTNIVGTTGVRFTVTPTVVGGYVRVIATGKGDFTGTVTSKASKKVKPLRSGGSNAPGYTLDLDKAAIGSMPAGWNAKGGDVASVQMIDGKKAVRIINKDPFTITVPFGPQQSVFDVSYDLYVQTNGIYPLWNDRYYSTKLSFLDKSGEIVAMNQPMTWGDCYGEFYWNGTGGYLGSKTNSVEDGTHMTEGQFVFTDRATAGKWFHFVYHFDFTAGTYTITMNDNPLYVSPACTKDVFEIPAASSEIVAIQFSDGFPESPTYNHLSESTYYYANMKVGDGGLNDVADNAWYRNSVNTAANLLGFDGGYFRPNTAVTRAEICKALGILAEISPAKYTATPFSDVAAASAYAPYVAWAAENGIVKGENGKFNPDAAITRQEMAEILYRYSEVLGLGLTAGNMSFTDAASIDDNAVTAAKAMATAGVIVGKRGNLFAPDDNATRAEAAAMLTRFMALLED